MGLKRMTMVGASHSAGMNEGVRGTVHSRRGHVRVKGAAERPGGRGNGNGPGLAEGGPARVVRGGSGAAEGCSGPGGGFGHRGVAGCYRFLDLEGAVGGAEGQLVG